MLLPATTGSGESVLVIARSANAVSVVGSLALSSEVSSSPPPDTETLLVTLAMLAPVVTVKVIGGNVPADATASVLVQVRVVGPAIPPPSGVHVQPVPL